MNPQILAVDHISWTVADLDAALAFYVGVLGATELWRMGPLDAAQMPKGADGRDWMESHVGVAGATLTLVMLKLTDTMNLQLVQYDAPADRRTTPPRNCDTGGHHLALRVKDVAATCAWLASHGCTIFDPIHITEGPLAGKTNVYARDPFGNSLEIVD
jgi:glyoxylase I family protein